MSSKSWLPLNSSDPALNAAIACVLAVIAITLVVVGGMFMLPVVAVIGIAKGVHWYANRPIPTDQLYAQAQQRGIAANFPDTDKYLEAFLDRFIDAMGDDLPTYQLYLAMARIAKAIYEYENLTNPLPPVAPGNTIEEGRYRDQLIAYQKKTQDAPHTLGVLNTALTKSFLDFIAALPPLAHSPRDKFLQDEDATPLATFFLIEVPSEAGKLIQTLILPFFAEEVLDLYLFQDLRKQLQHNTDEADCLPGEFKGDAQEAVATYLANTPLLHLFDAAIPFELPETTRFSGHWIVAPPGRGKTTLLHALVKHDLERDAALVLMDSKGDLIEPLKNLQSIKDRLVLIEPTPDSALALNPLDVSHASVIQVVNLIEYIMAGLLDAKFTALQSTLFRNVVPAIIEALPSPTLDDFKQVMVKGLPTLNQVNPHARQFFADRDTGFYSKTYDSTRKEIVWRLDYLMSNPILRSMFSATHTKLDLGRQMDAGSVIISSNSKAILGDEGAEFFGRFFVALIARAAQQRAGKPSSAKKPCYVYIDECQSVIAKDTRIPVLLDECRSQKIALILAHQRTAQLTPPVLDAVANCAIRMANSDDEARFLADKLRMSPDTLRSLPRGTFATFVRDLTPTGIQLKITKTDLDALPKMTDHELTAIRERMRTAFSSTPPAGKDESPTAQSVPAADPEPLAQDTLEDDPGEPAADWALKKK
jgi:hypothetical protein